MPPLLVHGHAAFLAYPASPALLEVIKQEANFCIK